MHEEVIYAVWGALAIFGLGLIVGYAVGKDRT